MAAKIKLMRLGTKRRPFYRIVVDDRKAAPKGDIIEVVGYYGPHRSKPQIQIHLEKIQGWLAKGVLPTEAVKKLLINQGGIQLTDAEKEAQAKRYAEIQARRNQAKASGEAKQGASKPSSESQPEAEPGQATKQETQEQATVKAS